MHPIKLKNDNTNKYVQNLGADDLRSRLTKSQLAELRKAQIEAVKTPQDKLNIGQLESSGRKVKTKGISSSEWKAHRNKLLEEWV